MKIVIFLCKCMSTKQISLLWTIRVNMNMNMNIKYTKLIKKKLIYRLLHLYPYLFCDEDAELETL